MRLFSGLIFLLICAKAAAIDPSRKNDSINVVHYDFQLEVNDSTDAIAGVATIDIEFLIESTSFELDLTSRDAKDGMAVTNVLSGTQTLRFEHKKDRLRIFLPYKIKASGHGLFRISYNGIARDGFVISKNKFGERGFYGDNWPDRGHNWLPVVDHPSDKASVDFTVIAPIAYAVVANGLKTEESFLDARRKITRYHEESPLPVKVMVVGIAGFAVEYAGSVDNISIQSWVYPQNKEAGFHDYGAAVKVLDFFHHHIGPYPFKKLANVQSKTRWGGLENAGAIFYAESTVTGNGDHENLIAHEEAHQWFGNSATEKEWIHVWLSEGFATYCSHLYLEHAYGHDRLVMEEKKDRDAVIKYAVTNSRPIVDTTVTDINTILNTNTYQKAGWVLHMLRHKIGDEVFWKGIRQYYATYHYSNALTGDFQRVMEEASGTDLNLFFKQWFWQGGHPKLSGFWHYDAKQKVVFLEINQTQTNGLFSFPLDFKIIGEKGNSQVITKDIEGKTTRLGIHFDQKPAGIVLDPDTWQLFEGQIKAQ